MLSKITNFINKHPIITSSIICAGYLLSTAGGYPTDNTSEFNNFNNSDYNSTNYLNSQYDYNDVDNSSNITIYLGGHILDSVYSNLMRLFPNAKIVNMTGDNYDYNSNSSYDDYY